MRRALAVLPLLAAAMAGESRAGEVRNAVAVLEVFTRTLPHQVPDAAPPRFALLEDGQVFVGGTRSLLAGKLSSRELRDLEKRLSGVRKLPGLAGDITLGPGERRHRLRLFKGGRPLDLRVTGEPEEARPEMRELATLLRELERFAHPTLGPYRPETYALSAREGTLRGGCRRWRTSPDVAMAVFAPIGVPARIAAGWPTGATPASVCAGDRNYVVTLRPLLPGEQP
ncbi:MAG TPA: hypothetical protein VMT87_06400 [Vicinamibacteria bacterium]|nr:hypothetical protein [Vicinamibacteria bacterium]